MGLNTTSRKLKAAGEGRDLCSENPGFGFCQFAQQVITKHQIHTKPCSRREQGGLHSHPHGASIILEKTETSNVSEEAQPVIAAVRDRENFLSNREIYLRKQRPSGREEGRPFCRGDI